MYVLLGEEVSCESFLDDLLIFTNFENSVCLRFVQRITKHMLLYPNGAPFILFLSYMIYLHELLNFLNALPLVGARRLFDWREN